MYRTLQILFHDQLAVRFELRMQGRIQLISVFLISIIFQCNGVSWQRQLEHIAKTRLESQGLLNEILPSRRYEYDPRELTSILGVPNRASHLPEAEAILPGHTLNRPALGMLKSSVKFPHKELENGAGVYGGFENLGIKYDSRNERLLYTGFRRFPSDYIMVIPLTSGVNSLKPRFKVESTVLDLDEKDEKQNRLLKIVKKLKNPAIKSNVRVYLGDVNKKFFNDLRTSEEADDYYNYDRYVNDDLYNLYSKKPALRNDETKDQKQKLELQPTENAFDLSDTDQEDKSKKTEWLFNSKDNFNHIKINQDAPEISEFIPQITDKDNQLRQWWYYNADDYKHFT